MLFNDWFTLQRDQKEFRSLLAGKGSIDNGDGLAGTGGTESRTIVGLSNCAGV